MEKYVLFRSAAGLNDLLCQIEKCCRYADKTGRRVLVDGTYQGSLHFRDNFSNYFISQSERLVLDVRDFDEILNEVDVFPSPMGGRLRDYKINWHRDHKCWYDPVAGVILSFDFSRSYVQRVLLHHQPGNNRLGQFFFLRARLHDRLVDMLEDRLQKIEQPYTAIHIRNTDYQTDYVDQIEKMADSVKGMVLVATDDPAALKFCTELWGRDRVFGFSDLSDTGGRGLHVHEASLTAEQIFLKNSDAILDLFMLAMSRSLVVLKMAGAVPYSGFSLLAKDLHSCVPILRSAIGRRSRVLDAFLPPG